MEARYVYVLYACLCPYLWCMVVCRGLGLESTGGATCLGVMVKDPSAWLALVEEAYTAEQGEDGSTVDTWDWKQSCDGATHFKKVGQRTEVTLELINGKGMLYIISVAKWADSDSTKNIEEHFKPGIEGGLASKLASSLASTGLHGFKREAYEVRVFL